MKIWSISSLKYRIFESGKSTKYSPTNIKRNLFWFFRLLILKLGIEWNRVAFDMNRAVFFVSKKQVFCWKWYFLSKTVKIVKHITHVVKLINQNYDIKMKTAVWCLDLGYHMIYGNFTNFEKHPRFYLFRPKWPILSKLVHYGSFGTILRKWAILTRRR